MKQLSSFILISLLCLTSCKDNTVSTTLHDSINSPVTTNVPNSFIYTVNANLFSDNSVNDLTFLQDSLVITLAASNYSSGQAVIVINDSSNIVLYSDTVKSNKTTVILQSKRSWPKHCNLTLTNLTAKLSFVLVGQTPTATTFIPISSTGTFEFPTVDGDEEVVRITKQASYFALSEIRRNAQTHFVAVYMYRPQAGYFGNDHVEIEISTGSDGAGPPTNVRTVGLNFKVSD